MSEDVPQYGEMNEQRAREILRQAQMADGSLNDQLNTIDWLRGNPTARMTGEFTADELEAIAWWMRNRA